MFHTYKQMIFEVNLPNGQSDFTVNLSHEFIQAEKTILICLKAMPVISTMLM